MWNNYSNFKVLLHSTMLYGRQVLRTQGGIFRFDFNRNLRLILL